MLCVRNQQNLWTFIMWHHKSHPNNGWQIFIMVAITMNLLIFLMKFSQHDNNGDYNPWLFHIHNKCTNTNKNFYWVTQYWTGSQHQFGDNRLGDGMNPTYKPVGDVL